MSDEKFLGVTHFTQVDVQPGGINIQHVEHLHQADILKALGIELEMKPKGKPAPATVPEPASNPSVHREELCPEICAYLKELKQKGKVMLPSNSAIMYNELVRLGMPTGDGYSEKHFSNSYTK